MKNWVPQRLTSRQMEALERERVVERSIDLTNNIPYASGIVDSFATTSKPRLNLLRIEEELSAVHLRLARVYVENKPYESVISRFDKPDTFFYVDPPYYGCEDYYGRGIFRREDFTMLRDILSNINGKFIMSINDVDEIRHLFKGFKIDRVGTTYSAGGAHKKKAVSELLISNY